MTTRANDRLRYPASIDPVATDGRDVNTAIDPSFCGSPNVPTMSSTPRSWNSVSRSTCAAKCGGAFVATSGADS